MVCARVISDIVFVIVLVLIPCQFFLNYFFIKKNDLVNADTYSHLRTAEELHDYRGIILYHSSYYPYKKLRYTYPPLLHVILAFLQERSSIYFRRTLSLWLNLLVVLVFAFVLYAVFDFSAEKIALAGGLYLITSVNYFETNAVTPRPLGILFFFIAGLGIVQFFSGNTQSWPYIVIGAAGLFLSHRMGVQTFLLFSIVFTIIAFVSFELIIFWLWVFLSMSFLITFLFTKGQVFHVLKDHFKRIHLHIMTGSQDDGGKKLGNPLRIVSKNPLILLLPFLIFKLPWTRNDNYIQNPLFVMMLICFVILFLSVFWIWGSAERHILFASPFLLILYFSQKTIPNNYLFLLFPVLILIVVKNLYSIWYVKRNKENRVDDDWRELASLIKKLKGRKLLILPEINIPYLTYATKKVIFSGAHDSSAVLFNRILLKRRLNEHSHIKKMAEKFNSDLVLIGDNYNNPLLAEYLNNHYMTRIHKCNHVLWEIK